MPGVFAVNGVNELAWFSNEFQNSYDRSVAELQSHGITYPELTISFHQASLTATSVSISSQELANLDAGILADKAAGLSVMVKPIDKIQDQGNASNWQALAPTDPAAWFASYKAQLLQLASVAQRDGADSLLLGNELQSMSTNAAYLPYWTDIITSVRQVFSGQIGYNALATNTTATQASGNEFFKTVFWSQVDFVGLSYYPTLTTSTSATNSVSAYKADFLNDVFGTNEVQAISSFAAQVGKPVEFTEIGAPAFDGENAARSTKLAPVPIADPQDQANFFEAAYEIWGPSGATWLKGFFPYEFNPGPAEDDQGIGQLDNIWSFSLADKPAGWVIGAWDSGAVTSGSQVTVGSATSTDLSGNPGAQLIMSGTTSHQIFAGIGNQTLLGGAGTDTLFATGGGNDVLVGGFNAGGATFEIGGIGRDTLVAGSGTTLMLGGGGQTTYAVPATSGGLTGIYNFHQGTDIVSIVPLVNSGLNSAAAQAALQLNTGGSSFLFLGTDPNNGNQAHWVILVGVAHVTASDLSILP